MRVLTLAVLTALLISCGGGGTSVKPKASAPDPLAPRYETSVGACWAVIERDGTIVIAVQKNYPFDVLNFDLDIIGRSASGEELLRYRAKGQISGYQSTQPFRTGIVPPASLSVLQFEIREWKGW